GCAVLVAPSRKLGRAPRPAEWLVTAVPGDAVPNVASDGVHPLGRTSIMPGLAFDVTRQFHLAQHYPVSAIGRRRFIDPAQQRFPRCPALPIGIAAVAAHGAWRAADDFAVSHAFERACGRFRTN